MVGREDLLNAIALNSSIFNAARTVGPAVAGVVVALIGEGLAFAMNAASFVFVIASLLLMRLSPFRPPSGVQRRGQLREGLRYIQNEPRVRALLIQAAAISLFCFAYIPCCRSSPVISCTLGQAAWGCSRRSAAWGR